MDIRESWAIIFKILQENLGRDPTPDEMQDAWQDYLGQVWIS
jgi:hypothetical protein